MLYSSVGPGDLAPDFTLQMQGGDSITLSSFRGQRVVLFFYPKDSSPGCTMQACDYRDRVAHFKRRGVTVLGVAPGTLRTKANFAKAKGLSFPLLNDADAAVCQAYGVWREKVLFGHRYFGVMRTTYLIGPDGRVERVWEKVNEKDDVPQVLAFLDGKATPRPARAPRQAARKK